MKSIRNIRSYALFALTALASATALANNFEKRSVAFKVDGQTIRGDLYLPKNAQNNASLPAVVVAGSLTSVKEQMSSTYAKELAARGIAALAFDYRHYGESDGMPRQLESEETKKADLKAAVAFLQTQPTINRQSVSLLGVCTSGGNVLQAAAEDSNVKSVVTVAGWFAEPSITPMLYGGEQAVAKLKQQGQDALKRYRASGTSDTVVVYGMAGSGAAHAGDHMDYYVNTRRGNIPQWKNSLAVQSWEPWLNFNPVAAAPKVKAPTMIIHSDDSALPDQAKKVFAALPGKKELTWLKGGHFDFYDDAAKVKETAAHAANFILANSGVNIASN
jgi:uncharacterized protein